MDTCIAEEEKNKIKKKHKSAEKNGISIYYQIKTYKTYWNLFFLP